MEAPVDRLTEIVQAIEHRRKRFFEADTTIHVRKVLLKEIGELITGIEHQLRQNSRMKYFCRDAAAEASMGRYLEKQLSRIIYHQQLGASPEDKKRIETELFALFGELNKKLWSFSESLSPKHMKSYYDEAVVLVDKINSITRDFPEDIENNNYFKNMLHDKLIVLKKMKTALV